MPTNILMPALSPMEKGTLAGWLKDELALPSVVEAAKAVCYR
jgi:hypothetical protein